MRGGARSVCQFCLNYNVAMTGASVRQFMIARQQVWLHPQCRAGYVKQKDALQVTPLADNIAKGNRHS